MSLTPPSSPEVVTTTWGISSAPCIAGDRLYYVSNRAELICADTEGFRDDEQNDGPIVDEAAQDEADADLAWTLDFIDALGVFPHKLALSSPLLVGDLLYMTTGNGVDEGHFDLPAPGAPSFIAVNKHTGKVAWASAAVCVHSSNHGRVGALQSMK